MLALSKRRCPIGGFLPPNYFSVKMPESYFPDFQVLVLTNNSNAHLLQRILQSIRDGDEPLGKYFVFFFYI